MSQAKPLLLPAPRHLELCAGHYLAPATLEQMLSQARTEETGDLPAEGFELELASDAIRIRHRDAAGLRYARGALEQLYRQYAPRLPCLRIRDWPDFPVRGYMLDVSRDRVPTRATLERVVGLCALYRINHLQLYTEHSFAYRDHELVWRHASPITPDDVRWLDALCREHGIELCANQNGFGHMGRWLRHAPYRHLAETPEGWQSSRGPMPPGVLAPSEQSLAFVLGLARELMSHFSSRRINIGCDETFELGKGRSRDAVEARGRGRVYLEFLSKLLEGLHADGREVLFWGDILRNHPELVRELPKHDTIALAWHYEAPIDTSQLPDSLFESIAEFGYTREALRGFEGQVPPFVDAGIPFWVCPGTSTWNTLLGRLANARANLEDAATVGHAQGAGGYLVTDWGDNGHLQPPSVSFGPLALGAAFAWCLDSNRDLELAPLLDAHVFEDEAGQLGRALEALGGLYTGTGLLAANASPLQTKLVEGGFLPTFGEPSEKGVTEVLEQLEDAAQKTAAARPRGSDGGIVQREIAQAIRLARHGAWRIAREAGFAAPALPELRLDLARAIDGQRSCWLERSRPGGLSDSIARLQTTLDSYG